MESPSILVVEDDQPLRSLLSAILTQNGYAFEAVGDGRLAIDCIRRKRYSAILLDLMLPDTNGFEVLQYVHAEKAELMQSIVVMTAASKHTLQDFDASTVGALVRKPFDIYRLLETIERISQRETPEPRADGNPPRISACLVH